MSARYLGSGGNVTDPAFVNLAASGVVTVNGIVELIHNGTGGAIVGPAANATTSTMIFGACLDYRQGASDTFVKVIPFMPGQLWEVDCANATSTAQLGQRHALSASRGYLHNTASDIASDPAKAVRATAVFLAYAVSGSTTGSGKLIGEFITEKTPVIIDTQT